MTIMLVDNFSGFLKVRIDWQHVSPTRILGRVRILEFPFVSLAKTDS
jgi:hypothetical protein